MRPQPILAAVLVTFVAGAALAASHSRDTFIAEEDSNGDGKVGKDEYAAGRARQFRAIDASGDGTISQGEYMQEFRARLDGGKVSPLPVSADLHRRQMSQTAIRFRVLDSNDDKAITPAEFDYSGWTMFIHHDTDKDGEVSKADPVKPEASN
ncbi:MAG: hypothetical protein B7Y99_13320 [Caulobacterales bacterium 32-69-10]|nr:MAG: hypothetical protein B7Y99_13320 [Caulobacterales bacterium 32-69-10]